MDIPFDDRANLAAEVEDLDLGLIREHLKKVGSDLYAYSLTQDLNRLAEDMQLVSGPLEYRKPRNVGLLMFSEHPEKYFRYARIEVVDIPDPTGTNMAEKIFTGPIQRQLAEALLYIKNYALKEAVIKSKSKAEADRIMNYPYAAVEEILSNAVYHRSYQINEPITVRITPAAMEITSFPGFDPSITDEKIKALDIRSMVAEALFLIAGTAFAIGISAMIGARDRASEAVSSYQAVLEGKGQSTTVTSDEPGPTPYITYTQFNADDNGQWLPNEIKDINAKNHLPPYPKHKS